MWEGFFPIKAKQTALLLFFVKIFKFVLFFFGSKKSFKTFSVPIGKGAFFPFAYQ